MSAEASHRYRSAWIPLNGADGTLTTRSTKKDVNHNTSSASFDHKAAPSTTKPMTATASVSPSKNGTGSGGDVGPLGGGFTTASEQHNKHGNSSASGMQLSDAGWFTETEALWPGQKFSLALQEFSKRSILFQETSAVQDVLVFASAQYGNVLVLDGVIQMTERDEFAYSEMMVHTPLCSWQPDANTYGSPSTTASKQSISVLIVGGGDGGVLRQVVTQYPSSFVERITVVDIDPVVVHVAKKFFGATPYFEDPRVSVVHTDAAEHVRDASVEGSYNVILGDTSDPVGPAASLFSPDFYESMNDALVPGGIVCVQAECFWIHLSLISDLVACCKDIFGTAEYATTMVPTYPCGQIGFILARKQLVSKTGALSCKVPIRQPDRMKELKWYSSSMHRAAFVLPPFVTRQLEGYHADNDTHLSANEVGRDLDYYANTKDDDRYRCFLKEFVLPKATGNAFTTGQGRSASTDQRRCREQHCFSVGSPSCSIQ